MSADSCIQIILQPDPKNTLHSYNIQVILSYGYVI